MDNHFTLKDWPTGLLLYVALAGLGLSAVGSVDSTTPINPSSEHTVDDSLEVFRDRMVEVGTWVFDHNSLRGEVDRGSVTWTFTADGALIIEDSDGTTEKTYSLVKRCGDYGEIGGGNISYLKVTSSRENEDCYVVGHLVDVGGAEGKISALDNERGNSLYLIPAE